MIQVQSQISIGFDFRVETDYMQVFVQMVFIHTLINAVEYLSWTPVKISAKSVLFIIIPSKVLNLSYQFPMMESCFARVFPLALISIFQCLRDRGTS